MEFIQDQKTIGIALLGGLLPALLWLWFWLREDKERPEPRGLILLTFLVGMSAVILVLPFEQLARLRITDSTTLTIMWAGAEELIKYFGVFLIAFRSVYADEPVDFPIYMITVALGFAALENTLFLIHPLSESNATVSLLTGNLRFLGATLLHAVSSAMVGIGIGLSFFSNWITKKMFLFGGLLTAILLHSLFNFFIIKNDGQNFFGVFGFLWVVTIISLLLFEKLRRMGDSIYGSSEEPEPAQV